MSWIFAMVGAGLGVCLLGVLGEWMAWRRERRTEQPPKPQGHYLVVPRTPTIQGQKQAILCTIHVCNRLGLSRPTVCYMIVPDHPPVIHKHILLKKE